MPDTARSCGRKRGHFQGPELEVVMGALDDDNVPVIVPPAVQRVAMRVAIDLGRAVLGMRRAGRGATAILDAIGCRHTQTLVRVARLRERDALLRRTDGTGLDGMTLTQGEMVAGVRAFDGRTVDVFRLPRHAAPVLARVGGAV